MLTHVENPSHHAGTNLGFGIKMVLVLTFYHVQQTNPQVRFA